MSLEAYRDVNFAEPERTPLENLSFSIAARILTERARDNDKLTIALGESYTEPPAFFQDALVDTMTKGVQSLITTQDLERSGLHSLSKLQEKVSDGDWVKLWEDSAKKDPEIAILTPGQFSTQVKMTTLLIEKTDGMNFVPPDADFQNTLKMLKKARKLSAEKSLGTEKFYQDDELYGELVRNTFTRDEYVKQWTRHQDAFSLPVFLRGISSLVLFIEQSETNRLHVPKKKSIKKMIKEMKEDENAMSTISTQYSAIQNVLSESLLSSVNRFWGVDINRRPRVEKK